MFIDDLVKEQWQEFCETEEYAEIFKRLAKDERRQEAVEALFKKAAKIGVISARAGSTGFRGNEMKDRVQINTGPMDSVFVGTTRDGWIYIEHDEEGMSMGMGISRFVELPQSRIREVIKAIKARIA